MIKVLFVCLGNICRSPMAEAVFNWQVDKRGLTGLLEGDSAGTSNYHIGDEADKRTLKILDKYNIPSNHLGRQLQHSDFQEFDYILVMDKSNFENTMQKRRESPSGKAEVKMMLEFDGNSLAKEVPDPYYGIIDDFENVFQMLNTANEKFLDFIILKHNL